MYLNKQEIYQNIQAEEPFNNIKEFIHVLMADVLCVTIFPLYRTFLRIFGGAKNE